MQRDLSIHSDFLKWAALVLYTWTVASKAPTVSCTGRYYWCLTRLSERCVQDIPWAAEMIGRKKIEMLEYEQTVFTCQKPGKSELRELDHLNTKQTLAQGFRPLLWLAWVARCCISLEPKNVSKKCPEVDTKRLQDLIRIPIPESDFFIWTIKLAKGNTERIRS